MAAYKLLCAVMTTAVFLACKGQASPPLDSKTTSFNLLRKNCYSNLRIVDRDPGDGWQPATVFFSAGACHGTEKLNLKTLDRYLRTDRVSVVRSAPSPTVQNGSGEPRQICARGTELILSQSCTDADRQSIRLGIAESSAVGALVVLGKRIAGVDIGKAGTRATPNDLKASPSSEFDLWIFAP